MSKAAAPLAPPIPERRPTTEIPPPPSEVAASLGIGVPNGTPRARILSRTVYGFRSERDQTWEDKQNRARQLAQSGWGCPRIRPEDVEANRRGLQHHQYRPLGEFVPWEDVIYGKYVAMGVPFGSQTHYKEVQEKKELAQVNDRPQQEALDGADQEYSAVHYKREPAPPPSTGFQTLRRRIRESESRLKATQAGGNFYDHVSAPVISAPPVTPSLDNGDDEPDDRDTVSPQPQRQVPALKLPKQDSTGPKSERILRQSTSTVSTKNKPGSQTARPVRRRGSAGVGIGVGTRYTRFIADRSLDPVWALEQTRTQFQNKKSELDAQLEAELDEQELNRRENYRQKFRAFHLALGEPVERDDDDDDMSGSPLVLYAAAETLGKLLVRAQRALINAPPAALAAAAAAAGPNAGVPAPLPTLLPLSIPQHVERKGSTASQGDFNIGVGTLEEMMRETRMAAEALQKVIDIRNDDVKQAAEDSLHAYKAAGQRRRGSVFSATLLDKSSDSTTFFLESDRVANHLNLAASAPDERTRVVAIEQLGGAKMDIKNVPRAICVMREILEGKAGQWSGADGTGLAFTATPRVSWRGNATRDLASMRLEARRARLERLITNHRHHPWYIDMLAEATKGGREITVPEQLIINQVKRLVELGQLFDRRMFYSVVRSVRPVDLRSVDVQNLLAFLRERAAEIPFPEYVRWLMAHNLPIPTSRNRTGPAGRDGDSDSPKRRLGSTLSTAMHVHQAASRMTPSRDRQSDDV